jgi:hypothetical protein
MLLQVMVGRQEEALGGGLVGAGNRGRGARARRAKGAGGTTGTVSSTGRRNRTVALRTVAASRLAVWPPLPSRLRAGFELTQVAPTSTSAIGTAADVQWVEEDRPWTSRDGEVEDAEVENENGEQKSGSVTGVVAGVDSYDAEAEPGCEFYHYAVTEEWHRVRDCRTRA